MTPGRVCPLHYRYSPEVFSRKADFSAETVYVIGGLYGNTLALDTILQLAVREPVPPLLIFNGDFHWFDIDPAHFNAINHEVMKHVALRGNVETELASATDDAGCGCAYPSTVDEGTVTRSNEILRRLRETAQRDPKCAAQLAALPMHTVVAIGDTRFGIVHGDAESLAGWRFAHDALHENTNVEWLHAVCRDADLAGFASSHTCLPTLRHFSDAQRGDTAHIVINNGAAGMPNFSRTEYGLISRLSIYPALDDTAQYGLLRDGVYVDAIPVHYDALQFQHEFLAQWPSGSAAHKSYFSRILNGPHYAPSHALGFVRAQTVCE